ncbi:AAA family ATPase [Mycolicibacterium sp. 3033]|nr:AAA family ATPase [Mycolicibacterium aurantiacum]
MRFEGFKRLARAQCNTDSRILAFVGSNESGKSTLLEGLAWLTDGNEDALPPVKANRSTPPTGLVVEATFELDKHDIAELADLAFAEAPKNFLIQKHIDGSLRIGVIPEPARDPKPFEEAAKRLRAAHQRLSTHFAAAAEEAETESDTPENWVRMVTEALNNPDRAWSSEVLSANDSLCKWLESVPETSRSSRPRDAQTAELLQAAVRIAQSPHPSREAPRRLQKRLPKFVMFRERDRVLSTVHDIGEERNRSRPQPALANLLRIADLDLDRLWQFIEQQDGSSRESYIEQANERLEDFFAQAWNQSELTVRLKVADSTLEVWLKEMRRGGPVTNIEERSDGLRTFVALAAFLASQRLTIPPVLLIDEAETHLHLDAQADLVGVLLKQVNATQVFYTTHSPGCLPTDLGTGIRLLRKDTRRDNASEIRSDFWTNQEPGFAPLLYAMGASAAAFSACRHAVLAEGPADMILLPTLIRMATGYSDLSYQIAPGLSAANSYDMRIEEIAAKVVYLVDGDGQGDIYADQLRAVGVDEKRIFHLPPGWASEDLVSRSTFIKVVNTLVNGIRHVSDDELGEGKPVVKLLEDWGRREGVKTPGHVAIAYGLINNSGQLDLAPGAKRTLRKLHAAWTAAFADR